MKKNIACIASASVASFYISELQSKQNPQMHLLKSIDNSDARLKESDIVSSASGRLGHDLAQPEHSAKETALSRYIKQVVSELNAFYEDQGKLDVVLVANPKLIGLIRKELPTNLAQAIVLEVEKDYVSLPSDQLSVTLRDLLHPVLKSD